TVRSKESALLKGLSLRWTRVTRELKLPWQRCFVASDSCVSVGVRLSRVKQQWSEVGCSIRNMAFCPNPGGDQTRGYCLAMHTFMGTSISTSQMSSPRMPIGITPYGKIAIT